MGQFFCRALVMMVTAAAALPIAAAQPPNQTLARTIRVPFDHFDLSLGKFTLDYELGAPFGSDFNVVGIINRGSSEEVQRRLMKSGAVDWALAWRLLRSEQWVEYIEAVRRDLLGRRDKLLLYGRSGGGMLLHQYLAKYGAQVVRAVSQSAPNPFLAAEFGLNSDRFWEEIGAYDPSLRTALQEVLEARATERDEILRVLQRQNFFVPRAELMEQRARLIRDLHAGKTELYSQLKRDYQVDAVREVLESRWGLQFECGFMNSISRSQIRRRWRVTAFSRTGRTPVPFPRRSCNFARRERFRRHEWISGTSTI